MMGPGPAVSTIKVPFDARRDDIRSILGAAGHYIADCSSADVDVPAANQHCRYFECDTEGIIKFDYKDDAGDTHTVVMKAKEGVNHYPNVVKVYRYYTGTTSCTAQAYDASGSLITGIRLVN
jgi:hypothetical protein